MFMPEVTLVTVNWGNGCKEIVPQENAESAGARQQAAAVEELAKKNFFRMAEDRGYRKADIFWTKHEVEDFQNEDDGKTYTFSVYSGYTTLKTLWLYQMLEDGKPHGKPEFHVLERKFNVSAK